MEVCNSKLAAQVLRDKPRLVAVMPCRIAVYKMGDKTVVTMILPSHLMTLFPPQPELKEATVQLDRDMKAITDTKTR